MNNWEISFIWILFGLTAYSLTSCVSFNEPKFEGKALFDVDNIHCPRGTFVYCEGPNRKNLTCNCAKAIGTVDWL